MSGLQPTVQIEGEPAPNQVQPSASSGPRNYDPDRVEYGTDARGRKIGVKRNSLSVRRRVANVVSVENSQKPLYIGPAIVACCCDSINGVRVDFPQSELALNSLMDRLEDEGVRCISDVLAKHFTISDADIIKN